MTSSLLVACLSACYAVALGLEFAKLVRPSKFQRTLILGFALCGLVVHSWYLGARAHRADACPLSSPHDWYLLAAWLLAVVYLGLSAARSAAALGLFSLPLVLLLVGLSQWADQAPFAPARASRFWGNLHGAFLLLGTVSVSIGFVAGMMYLLQSYRLKSKPLAWQGMRLPSLEWLERVNRLALAASVPLVGIGFLAGVILNRIRDAGQQSVLPWNDPVMISSAAMLAWLILAELFRLTYRAARRGRKVAYLTVVSFVFLAISLAVLLFVETQHAPGGHLP
jgi:ABC-type uncharacterized transport system permease subunit